MAADRKRKDRDSSNSGDSPDDKEPKQPDQSAGDEGREDVGEEELAKEATSYEPEEQEVSAAATLEAEQREGNRILNFLRASWGELQRVQWPDRQEVIQATAIVLVFVAILGAYLGFADFVFQRLVQAII